MLRRARVGAESCVRGHAVEALAERFPRFSADVARHMARHGTRPSGPLREWKFDPLHQTISPHPYTIRRARAFWERVTERVVCVESPEVAECAKLLENSVDYSIQQTTRHALFLPTSREAKYKAKAAIDSFFWRMGDMLQAGVVFVGTQLAFGIREFATFNVVMTFVWLGLVWMIAREHRRLTEGEGTPAATEAA